MVILMDLPLRIIWALTYMKIGVNKHLRKELGHLILKLHLEDLNASLDDKVYFAGETYNTHGITPNRGFYIIRGSVQSAILSGYDVVEQILE